MAGRPSRKSTFVRRAVLAFAALAVATLALAARADAFVYWANTGTGDIGRAPLTGANPNQQFVPEVSPTAVAVDGEHIYWASAQNGSIGRADIQDGGNITESLITGANNPLGVAVTSTHIYWTNFGDGTIGSADLNADGSVSNIKQDFITGATDPIGIAVDLSRTHIYWTNQGAGSVGRADLNADGSVSNITQNFITGAHAINGLAVGAVHIYWSNQTTAMIGRADLNGLNVDQNFIAANGATDGVAVDADHVYWTNLTRKTIGRADLNLPNGPVSNITQDFIKGASEPTGLAVDALQPPPPQAVSIAIAGRNQLLGRGVAWVAVHSTSEFDAATVDPASVCFGDAEAPAERDCTELDGKSSLLDLTNDRRRDALLMFETHQAGIDPGDTMACLTGTTFDGTPIEGCASIVGIPNLPFSLLPPGQPPFL